MRSGAVEGDALFVTGSLGDSALALQLLQAGRQPDPFLLRRHNDPPARVTTGLALTAAHVPSAMIDISDGLLADLEHILELSGVGAVVEQQALPLSEPFRQGLKSNPGLTELALAGGEDYELLFTAAETKADVIAQVAQKCGVPISKVGKIVAESGQLRLLGPGGELDLPRNRGYKHFPETA